MRLLCVLIVLSALTVVAWPLGLAGWGFFAYLAGREAGSRRGKDRAGRQ